MLAFVIFHLLHLTAGYIHPARRSSKAMCTTTWSLAFRSGGSPLWYIFSMILLGLHLRHGIWSMFQSLGMNHPRHTPILKSAAVWSPSLLSLGYISIPISVLLGLVK